MLQVSDQSSAVVDAEFNSSRPTPVAIPVAHRHNAECEPLECVCCLKSLLEIQ